MATYSKPTSIPRWADVSGTITEPPSGKKDVGWVFEDVPPAAYENWLQYTTGEWFKWIDERFSDGTTTDDLTLNLSGVFRVGDLNALGGLSVGFSNDTPTDDVIAVGDANCRLDMSTATTPTLYFDSDNYVICDRTADTITWYLATAAEMFLTADGLQIGNGLVVGTGAVPWDDDIRATGGINCGGTTNPAAGDGIFTHGLTVGFDALPAGADQVQIGDGNFRLILNGTMPRLIWDSADYIQFDRSTNAWTWNIAATLEMQLGTTGLQIANGLRVGSTSTINNNDVMADGGINCGGSTNPNTGDGIFTNGLVVGFDGAASADEIQLGASTAGIDYNAGNFLINFNAQDYIRFDATGNDIEFNLGASSTTVYSFDSSGQLFIGDSVDSVRGSVILDSGNAAGNISVGTNACGIFAKDFNDGGGLDARLFAVDQDGVTQISPHDPVTGEWYFRDFRYSRGTERIVWMERLVKAVEELTGQSFTDIRQITDEEYREKELADAARIQSEQAKKQRRMTYKADRQLRVAELTAPE